jgi:hypothetical protein
MEKIKLIYFSIDINIIKYKFYYKLKKKQLKMRNENILFYLIIFL